MKRISFFLKSLLHLAFPLAERLLPQGPAERLVGGLLTLPVRLAGLAVAFAVYLGLIYLGEFLISEILYRFVVLLKLPKVFRIDWLEPSFFGMLGFQFRRAGLVVLGLFAAYRILGTAGSAVYLTDREIIVLKRWPFSASVIRIPLSAVRYAVFSQIPGERLLTTGRIELAWSDRESLTLPGVPLGEKKLALIMEKLHGRHGRHGGADRNDGRRGGHGQGRQRNEHNRSDGSPHNRNGKRQASNDGRERGESQGRGRRRRRGRGRGRENHLDREKQDRAGLPPSEKTDHEVL